MGACVLPGSRVGSRRAAVHCALAASQVVLARTCHRTLMYNIFSPIPQGQHRGGAVESVQDKRAGERIDWLTTNTTIRRSCRFESRQGRRMPKRLRTLLAFWDGMVLKAERRGVLESFLLDVFMRARCVLGWDVRMGWDAGHGHGRGVLKAPWQHEMGSSSPTRDGFCCCLTWQARGLRPLSLRVFLETIFTFVSLHPGFDLVICTMQHLVWLRHTFNFCGCGNPVRDIHSPQELGLEYVECLVFSQNTIGSLITGACEVHHLLSVAARHLARKEGRRNTPSMSAGVLRKVKKIPRGCPVVKDSVKVENSRTVLL
jgi:hypothetical protein